MEVVRKILYIIGGLALLALSPVLIGAVLIWTIGIIVCQCLSLLVAQVIMTFNPNMRIKESQTPILLVLLNLIPTLLRGTKSKHEKIVLVIAGIIGAILAVIDCWLLGEDYYWIPILVGILIYFLLNVIMKKKEKHCDVLDDSNRIELIRSEKECYDIAQKGADYLKENLYSNDWGIEPLLLCSAILLNFNQSEQDTTYYKTYRKLLEQDVLNLHDVSEWEYLFANATPGMVTEDYGCKLLDFAKKKGKMKICINQDINSGNPICVFIDSNDNRTWVHFSKEVGYLSAEEITERKDKLCVVERSYNYYVLINSQEEYITHTLSRYITDRLSVYRKLILKINSVKGQDNEAIIKYLYALLSKKQYQLYTSSDIEDSETLNIIEDLYLIDYPKDIKDYSRYFYSVITGLVRYLNRELNK